MKEGEKMPVDPDQLDRVSRAWLLKRINERQGWPLNAYEEWLAQTADEIRHGPLSCTWKITK